MLERKGKKHGKERERETQYYGYGEEVERLRAEGR
jgi:hypothetical protein